MATERTVGISTSDLINRVVSQAPLFDKRNKAVFKTRLWKFEISVWIDKLVRKIHWFSAFTFRFWILEQDRNFEADITAVEKVAAQYLSGK